MNKASLTSILKNFSTHGYSKTVSECLERLDLQKKTIIFTPNSEMLSKAMRSDELRHMLLSADILFPDGIGAYMSMKALGFSPVERTAGIELAENLLHETAKRGYKVFLLGSKRGVAVKAAKRLCNKYRGLNICGCHHGYFEKSGKDNDRLIQKINHSGADILFVCFGFPSQEKWIAENFRHLDSVKLCIGLGGSLDVWSGDISRAPEAVSSMGLEWLWRTAKDPQRFTRLPSLLDFSLFTIKEYVSKHQKRYKCYEIDNFLK